MTLLPHEDPTLYTRIKPKQTESVKTPIPPPIVASREVPMRFVRARATAANPHGNVKDVEIDLSAIEGYVDRKIDVPSSVVSCLKHVQKIVDPYENRKLLLLYSCGYEMDASGFAKRKAIWETSFSEEEGKPRRRKVGEAELQPVDSFMIGVIVRQDSQWLAAEGLWIDGKPDSFIYSTHNSCIATTNLTTWKKAIEDYAPRTPHLLVEE